MNSPGNGPSSIDTRIDQIDSQFFPLSQEQIARARGLGISDERLREIQERNLNSRLFLGTIRRHKRALSYLKYVTQKASPHGPILREDTMKEWSTETIQDDITLLIEELFVEKYTSKNIPFVAAYVVEDYHEREWYLHIIGLLAFWKELGTQHSSYARLPKEGELKNRKEVQKLDKIYDEARVIWEDYTGRVVGNQLKGYSLSYDLYAYDDAGKAVYKYIIQNEPLAREKVKAFPHAGRSPRKKGEKYSQAEIEYLEELFTIAGNVPLIYTLPVPLLAEFIEKHEAYFRANPARYTWDAGKQIIERLTSGNPKQAGDKVRTKGPKKGPSGTVSATSPYTSNLGEPQSARLKSPEKEPSFSKPEISSAFANILRLRNEYLQTANKTANNFPKNGLLWIGTVGTPTTWKSYSHEDIVHIEAISTSTNFLFCYTEEDFDGDEPPEIKKFPRTLIEVVPRTITEPPTGNQSGNRVIQTTAVVTTLIDGTPSLPIGERKPDVAKILDRTDEVGLEIIDIVEARPDDIIISRTHPLLPEIEGVFRTTPALHFHIDTDEETLELGPKNLPGVDIKRLEGDIAGIIPLLLKLASRLREELYLEGFSKIRNKLSYLLGTLTQEFEPREDTEAVEIADILESATINHRYGGDIFMSSLHRGKFEAIRALLLKEGLEIDLVDDGVPRGKNYSVTVTLDDGMGGKILYKISRKEEAPFFAFSSKASGFSAKIDGYFRGASLDIYLILALIGKEIFSTQPGATPTSRRSYSEEQIRKILDGSYQNEKRAPGSFTVGEKTLISQAAQRVKNGNLKISKGETSEYKSGLMLPNILTARSIMEFHALEESDEIVLVDTKFTCIDDEKARQIEEKWEKRKRKHPYSATYAILRHHERSRKYLIRRMVATQTGENFRGLSPFSNRMEQFFSEFWRSVPLETRREFLEAVSGKGGHAGKGQMVMLPDGRGLLDAFIEEADERKIPFLYSKPKTLSKGVIIDYIQSEDYKNWLATLTRERPDMGEVRGK